MRKILFVGHGTCQNRGCEAIVRCSSDLIHQYLPDSSFSVISNTAEYDSSLVYNWPTPVKFIPYLRRRTIHTAISSLRRRLGFSLGYPEGLYCQRNMHGYYSRADVVVAVGGDNFTESYGVDSAVTHINYIKYAQHIKKPTVIWAASIGPFYDEKLRDLAIKIFKETTLITVRERWSQEYLRDLGISHNVQLVADPAFLLKRRRTKRTASISNSSTEFTIGLGISALKSKFLGVSRIEYEQNMAKFINYVTHTYDATVLLIPHVMYEGNDDLLACRAVREKAERKDRIIFSEDYYNMHVDELKQVIAQCDFFIGYRTHSTIAALSSYIPTIAIAYSKKAWGIFKEVYGHSSYVVDGSSMTVENLIKTFESLISHRESIVQILQKRIPEQKMLAKKAGAYLAAILRD